MRRAGVALLLIAVCAGCAPGTGTRSTSDTRFVEGSVSKLRSTLRSMRGDPVVVNFWATWCVPCREEMPALDRLQAELGGPDFQVVAINVDTRNREKPKAWLQENGISNLAYHADPEGRILQVLQKSGHVVGLPTTFVVDASGCEIALLKGPAEWASPDAVAFMRTALGRT